MRRLIFCTMMVMALLGCNKETDLSGIEQELSDLRDKNKHLQEEIDEMKKPVPADPVLLGLNFWAADNATLLAADVKGCMRQLSAMQMASQPSALEGIISVSRLHKTSINMVLIFSILTVKRFGTM